MPQRNKLYLALNKQAELVSINFVEGLFKGFIETKKDIKPHLSYLEENILKHYLHSQSGKQALPHFLNLHFL